MPPLAKTFVEVHGPLHRQNQSYAKPPPLTASTSTGSASSSTCSTTTSTTSRSSACSTTTSSACSARSISVVSPQGRRAKSASLTAFHAVKSSLRAILMFLEMNGVSRACIQKLAQMIAQKQFLQALTRAEEYVERILVVLCSGEQQQQHDNTNDNLDAIIMLFSAAWTKLVEYTRSNFQKVRKEYARHENAQWQEFIAQQGLSDTARAERKQRRLLEWDPKERQKLIHNLNHWTRTKMDSEKGLVLHQEWIRYIRVQQEVHRKNTQQEKKLRRPAPHH